MVRLKNRFFVANRIVLETFSQKVLEGVCGLFDGLCNYLHYLPTQSAASLLKIVSPAFLKREALAITQYIYYS